MNRVIQGQYAPGSTFKIVMATAALEEGVITPATTVLLPGLPLRLQHGLPLPQGRRATGSWTCTQAIAQSCNVFFYNVGHPPGDRRASRSYAKKMGLGAPTGIDLPHEVRGPHPEPGVEDADPEGAVVRAARRSRWPSARAR